jgi:predicted phosphodiesterase
MTAPLALTGPLLLFGGPYSNLEATRAVLAEAERRQIPPERIVCTGDVVAYGADAKATVDLVRASGIRVVMGNCEEALSVGAADCGCGFAPGSDCERLSAAWFAHADRQLDADARAWMASLPRRLDVELAGLALAVVHGSVTEINHFVFASTPDRVKALDLALSGVDGVVAGHCGLPFTQVIQDRLWHNPGVVGLQANDGTLRVWFSILTPGPEPRSLVVEHLALAYDDKAAATKMRVAGLPEGYADALASGLWPSCDVLPSQEAKAQGVSLKAGKLIWRREGLTATVAEHLGWPVETVSPPAQLDPGRFCDQVLIATTSSRVDPISPWTELQVP